MAYAGEWAGSRLLLRSNDLIGHPEFFVCKRIGMIGVSLGEQTRGLPATGNAELAPCFAEAVINRVHRKAEVSRDGFGVMSRQQQPQRLLLSFTQ